MQFIVQFTICLHCATSILRDIILSNVQFTVGLSYVSHIMVFQPVPLLYFPGCYASLYNPHPIHVCIASVQSKYIAYSRYGRAMKLRLHANK